MYYVVLDLEWNQYHNPMWIPTSRAGVAMRDEIIQIGAVKVDEAMTPVDTFDMYVRLGGRRRLDRHVKKLTHIDESDLLSGEDFPAAAEMFEAWLGDTTAIISWGNEDMRVYLSNLAFYGIAAPNLAWFDGQKIFAKQVPEHGKLGLNAIAEESGLRINLPLHNALNDALLTACVLQKVNMEQGIREYNADKSAKPSTLTPLSTAKTHRHPTKEAAWEEAGATLLHCPKCISALSWQEGEQGSIDRWYKRASCDRHGEFIIKGEFLGQKAYTLKLSFFEPTEEVNQMIEAELNPSKSKRKRRRSRGSKAQASAAQAQPLTGDELFTKAVAFAAKAHEGQLLEPVQTPYIVHPMEVTQILSTLTDDSVLLAAAMLHDVPVKCPGISFEMLEAEFGAHVCMLLENLQSGEAGEEELKLMLADSLSGLRGLARVSTPEFWKQLGQRSIKRQMAADFRERLLKFEPLKATAAYEEYERLIKGVFGRIKL